MPGNGDMQRQLQIVDVPMRHPRIVQDSSHASAKPGRELAHVRVVLEAAVLLDLAQRRSEATATHDDGIAASKGEVQVRRRLLIETTCAHDAPGPTLCCQWKRVRLVVASSTSYDCHGCTSTTHRTTCVELNADLVRLSTD
jgi:hypothetical protein